MLDIMQKWNAIQTPLATGIVNGLPALDDVYCAWGEDGLIHVFRIEPLKPWQAPVDITESVSENKRLIIRALALGQDDTLPQAMQDAIVAAEEAALSTDEFSAAERQALRALLIAHEVVE